MYLSTHFWALGPTKGHKSDKDEVEEGQKHKTSNIEANNAIEGHKLHQ